MRLCATTGIIVKTINEATDRRLREIEEKLSAIGIDAETLVSLQKEKEKLAAERDSALVKAEEQALFIERLGEHKKALEYYLKTVSIREKSLSADQLDLAILYANTAGIYYNLKDYPASIIYYLKSIAIEEVILDSAHKELATVYNNIGLAYAKNRQFPQAKEYFEKHQAINHSEPGRVFRTWACILPYKTTKSVRSKICKNLLNPATIT
jgi:tetratricopeptide (TPR) repeat protein